MLRCEVHDARGHFSSLVCPARFRVDQERVVATVADDVDEPDYGAVSDSCCHPSKTVRADLIPPPRHGRPTMRRHKIDHLAVIQRPAPSQDNGVRKRFDRFGSHAHERYSAWR